MIGTTKLKNQRDWKFEGYFPPALPCSIEYMEWDLISRRAEGSHEGLVLAEKPLSL